MKTLRQRGLEISPSRLVTSHVEDLPVKNEMLEQHIYRCIALGAVSQNFSFLWSRWNSVAGKDNFVFQVQMFDGDCLSPARLVQVTPQRVRLLPFSETTQSLEDGNASDEPSVSAVQTTTREILQLDSQLVVILSRYLFSPIVLHRFVRRSGRRVSAVGRQEAGRPVAAFRQHHLQFTGRY